MKKSKNIEKIRVHNYFVYFVFLFLALSKLKAQNPDLGTWNIVNLKYNYDERWSAFAEAQLRSLKLYNHYHYYEYKAAISCKINKEVQLTLGAGNYQTYKEGGNFVLPKNNDEYRIWPQLIFFQSIGKFKIEQRYRAEARISDNNGYRNRFRYRLAIGYAFGKEKENYKPFQVSLSNELFFTNNEPYFERNRATITFAYKLSQATSIQLGYLHQFDYKINDETGRDFLQIGIYFDVFRKNDKVEMFK